MLFGASLLVLIAGSFWLYGRQMEHDVHDSSRQTGQHLVDATMLKHHVRGYNTALDDRQLAEDMIEALENLQYDSEFISLTPDPTGEKTVAPANAQELALIEELRQEYLQQLRKEKQLRDAKRAEQGPETSSTEQAYDPMEDLEKHIVPKFKEMIHVVEGEPVYRYYQPVYWYEACVGCHAMRDPSVFKDYLAQEKTIETSGRKQPIFDENLPFVVVRASIPDPSRRNINRIYAILYAVAICITFLAMVAFYAVVRYLIVKPLKHLRDVSDEVARGNYELSADLKTNDEFEEVARSFNRMVRHLVDSHKQLRNANDALDAKVDELAQLNMQLYEMNRLKSAFLTNMSHELRTPLNSIIGFADVLQGLESLEEKQRRYAQNIAKSGRVLLDMINDILDLAKVESGKMEVRPSEFQVETVVRAQCEIVRPLARDKNIDVEVQSGGNLPLMFQDQGKLQQILTNLLSNAIKFTPEGGRIDVLLAIHPPLRTDHDVPTLALTVRDTGVGIAEEDREIIFEKFRQAKGAPGDDTLTRAFSGTGLGLSIVKELCKLLGGEITFTSQLGKGSSFTALIPWVLPNPSPAAFDSEASDIVIGA
jgi:signal transduction histidine kinase